MGTRTIPLGAERCEDCDGEGVVEDPSSVGCSDRSCCSPGTMWCEYCYGLGYITKTAPEGGGDG